MSLKPCAGDKKLSVLLPRYHSLPLLILHTYVHCFELETKTCSSFRSTWYVTVTMAFNRYFPIVDSSSSHVCVCWLMLTVICIFNSQIYCKRNLTCIFPCITMLLLNCTINSIILHFIYKKRWGSSRSNAISNTSDKRAYEQSVLRSRWHIFKRLFQYDW